MSFLFPLRHLALVLSSASTTSSGFGFASVPECSSDQQTLVLVPLALLHAVCSTLFPAHGLTGLRQRMKHSSCPSLVLRVQRKTSPADPAAQNFYSGLTVLLTSMPRALPWTSPSVRPHGHAAGPQALSRTRQWDSSGA